MSRIASAIFCKRAAVAASDDVMVMVTPLSIFIDLDPGAGAAHHATAHHAHHAAAVAHRSRMRCILVRGARKTCAANLGCASSRERLLRRRGLAFDRKLDGGRMEKRPVGGTALDCALDRRELAIGQTCRHMHLERDAANPGHRQAILVCVDLDPETLGRQPPAVQIGRREIVGTGGDRCDKRIQRRWTAILAPRDGGRLVKDEIVDPDPSSACHFPDRVDDGSHEGPLSVPRVCRKRTACDKPRTRYENAAPAVSGVQSLRASPFLGLALARPLRWHASR